MGRTQTGKHIVPIALAPRERTSFDADWLFHLGDVETGQAQALDVRRWRKLDLPHDWSIEGAISEDNPAGPAGGFFPGGIGWYRKQFTASAEWAGRKVAIEFDGIYWHSDVWINGHHLGHRPNGYVSLHYDLTDHLNIGGPNVLAVRVDNSRQPNSRWYSGSGIYRHVWITVTGRLRLARWSPCITTPRASGGAATLAVSSTVCNETGSAAAVTLRSTVLGSAGRAVAAAESGDSILAGREQRFEQVLTVGDPDLWSPEAPSLYTLRGEVLREGKVVDAAETTFGIRSVVFDANRGLLLNGRPVKMHGVCEHHDGGCVGAAVPDAVLARRLRILKEMGCNAIRTAHNPPSPVLLDMCDRMGFLVIDEGFDEWTIPKKPHGYATLFEKWWHLDLADWVHRDRNHPCVILWSLGNEIREQFSQAGVEIARRLVDAVARLDPTRPATCGCNWLEGEKVWIAPEFDVIGINGGGGGCFQYENFHRDNPGWKLYASEVPHTLQTRGVYQTVTHYRDKDPRGGILETPNLAEPEVFAGIDPNYRSAYDNAYVRTNCRNSWAATKKHDFLAGEFRWSGFDYLGESLGWPRRCWNFGIIDLCGFPKDSYYFYRSQWTAEPMVHILPHWTWPGKEGVQIPVVAYSNCEEVELLLNGRSLGRKTIADKLDLAWLVPYEPGTLKAVAYKSGRQAAEKQYTTAGPPAAIRLAPDRRTIDADGKDVVHVTVEIVDAAGNLVPYADNRVRFEVSGPGRIIGVDNGDPLDHEPVKADNRKAFFGMCLAIVQSTAQVGTIRTAASSDALRGDGVLIAAGHKA
jgi:beta-galactosidase